MIFKAKAKRLEGPAEIRTRIFGFKVQCVNHFTTGPWLRYEHSPANKIKLLAAPLMSVLRASVCVGEKIDYTHAASTERQRVEIRGERETYDIVDTAEACFSLRLLLLVANSDIK